MEIQNNSAFLLRNPDQVFEVLEQMSGTPCRFHCYLIGKYNIKSHPNVSVIPFENTRQIAGFVASDMTKRRMTQIVCTAEDIPTKDKVQELQTIDSSFALQGGSLTAMENVWTNLPKILDNYTVDSIGNQLVGKPVVIVSSGPSLNKNINTLKELQDRCVIVACSSSLVVLKENGITPHFCIALDPFALSHDLLVNNLDDRTVLVSALMLNHKLVDECKGKKLFFLGEYDTRILKDTILSTGMNRVFATNSTITVSAFAFAYHLGANPIILIGQDMCYEDDKEHGGTLDQKFDKNLYQCEYESVDGRKVKSCLAYKEVFDYFNVLVPSIKDRKIINATEGGAGIHGAEVLTLAETAQKYMNQPLTMPGFHPHTFNRLKYRKRLSKTVSELNNILTRVRGYVKKISPLIEAAQAGDVESQNVLVGKVDKWMDGIRIMPSYVLTETFTLWVWNWATTSPNWQDRLVLLGNLEAVLVKLVNLIKKAAEI